MHKISTIIKKFLYFKHSHRLVNLIPVESITNPKKSDNSFLSKSNLYHFSVASLCSMW